MHVIGFYVDHFNYRGTNDARHRYAHYNEVLLGNKSILFRRLPALCPQFDNAEVEAQANARFTVLYYRTLEELTQLCKTHKVEAVYYIVGDANSKLDCPPGMHRFYHCVFSMNIPSTSDFPTTYAGISTTIGEPHVDHMVEIASSNEDLRADLGIPKDAVVFGRHGGADCYDPYYVTEAVIELAQQNSKVFFVFMPRPMTFNRYGKLPANIIFLPPSVDPVHKRKFLNTCDAMIHSKAIGESFGLACMEFSAANKPVLTHACTHPCNHNQHLLNLGDKAWVFKDKSSCLAQMNKLVSNIDHVRNMDWNVAGQFTPEKVMKQFNEVFIAALSK
jgi:hypothetical protein